MNYQIILTKDVPNLGSLGDELVVKGGYARNYLIPKGLAIAANRKNAAEYKHRRLYLEKLRQTAIESAQTQTETVAQLELKINAKAGKTGKLFGSITNREISTQLELLGHSIDRRHISLPKPIRHLGNHIFIIKLHSQVRVELNLKVEPEEKLPAPDDPKKQPEKSSPLPAQELNQKVAAPPATDAPATDSTATDSIAASPDTDKTEKNKAASPDISS